MDLRSDARIPFPREAVFAVYRDSLDELLPYLPNVRAISLTSREENGPVVTLVKDWRGGGDVPAAIRAVLGDAALSWTDYSTWNAETLRCEWRIETRVLSGAIRCSGQNVFLEDGPLKMLLEVRGALDVDAKKIPGVPGFLAGKIGRTAEEFLVGKIQANLAETAAGLARYMAEKK
jgi:hypothetical protein